MYSDELKKLIGRLNDETIEAANKKPTTSINLNKNDEVPEHAEFDSGEDITEI